MKYKHNVWDFILEQTENAHQVVLLYVIESIGSSPGREGFSMAVSEDGSMFGSIGGGIMEFKWVEYAKELFKQNLIHPLIKNQVHNKDSQADRSGMICSGSQRLFIRKIQRADLSCIRKLNEAAYSNSKISFQFTNQGIAIQEAQSDYLGLHLTQDHQNWKYTGTINIRPVLHIVGGGHCSLALSKIMADMEFYIHVYDSRSNLNTLEANIYASEKHLIDDYSKTSIEANQDEYLVVMTIGYRMDMEVLRALQGKYFKYIGVLGSKLKMQELLENLKNEGISSDWLDTLYAPIGVPIRSQTPTEIAISIAAQIIQIKNALKN